MSIYALAQPTTVAAYDIAVVIVHYRTPEETLRCLRSVLAKAESPVLVIVVDNASLDGSADWLRDQLGALADGPKLFKLADPGSAAELDRLGALDPDQRSRVIFIESKENGGYASGNNLGLKTARELGADLFLIINSDVELSSPFVERLRASFAANPRLGLLGAEILDAEGKVQSRGARLAPLKHTAVMNCDTRPRAPEFVPGCFVALRREVLESTGYLPEEYFLYFEDVDYSFQARKKGWELAIEPELRATHVEGASSGGAVNFFRVFWTERGKVLFLRRHRPWALMWHLLYVFLRVLVVSLSPRRRFEIRPLLQGAFQGLISRRRGPRTEG